MGCVAIQLPQGKQIHENGHSSEFFISLDGIFKNNFILDFRKYLSFLGLTLFTIVSTFA